VNVKHIAIILDGNRRWAKERGLFPTKGHEKGAKTLEEIAIYANEIGLKYLTVYIFSTENWKRSKEEVTFLMGLFKSYFTKLSKKMNSKNIKIKFFGSEEEITDELKKLKDDVENITKGATGLQLNLCFNYGGRREIVETVKKISNKVKNGEILVDDITEELFSRNLYSEGIEDPDIMIRTSGEKRLSNFLPWQLTYTEFFFLDKYWPDFKKEDLNGIISEYETRDRRMGGK
jgi:di-trans,poly-cis-decaprenylcistransferase